jgi:uncharacterized protein
LTGKSTGDSTDLDELKIIHEQQSKLKLPVLIGSGVTKENLHEYVKLCDGMIIGSHFKHDGHWSNELSIERINDFMKHFNEILE